MNRILSKETEKRKKKSVRIIGGHYRSRLIYFSTQPGLRPTSNRVRETLFNWLGQDLTDKSCLDLFAGSGALGFESASRGAKRVLMVEKNREVLGYLLINKEKFMADTIEIIAADAVQLVGTIQERFDIIFLDPPFSQNLLPTVVPYMVSLLKPEGWLYIESTLLPEVEGLEIYRQDNAGMVKYGLYKAQCFEK